MLRSPVQISLFFLALHLALAGFIPLVEDEAYYALWASDLAPGYYDHPPMVAWFIWPGVELFGLHPLGVRLLGVFGATAAGLMVWDTVRYLTRNSRDGVWALLFYNLSVLTMALSWIATPDAPSAVFWVMAIWAAVRAKDSKGWVWWLILGLAVGAGGISKFSNAFVGLGIFLWLIATSEGRRQMTSIRPYVAMVLAVLVMAPYLIWNITNDWVGLERQLTRVGSQELSLWFAGEYLISLIILPTPVIAYFALKGSVQKSDGRQLLLWATLPFVIYMGYHSLSQQVQLNWTAPLQAIFAIWAGLYIGGISNRIAGLAAGIGLALSGPVLVLAASPWVPLGTAHNPPNQMRGWNEATIAFQEAIAESDAKWIATKHYGRTGRLWYQLNPMPVWSVTEANRYMFREAFPEHLCEATALLVLEEAGSTEEALKYFKTVTAQGQISRTHLGLTLAQYQLFKVSGLRSTETCSGN